jgi:integrase
MRAKDDNCLTALGFHRAVKWGLVVTNPVSNSEPPVPKKHKGMALLPKEQMLLIESASGPACLPMFLELSAATGARRGEVLALRWPDIDCSDVLIARSLPQTRQGLEFKGTKTDRPRRVGLPESVLVSLAVHQQKQDELRQQFGSDYRNDLNLIFANPDGTPLPIRFRLPFPYSAGILAFRRVRASTPCATATARCCWRMEWTWPRYRNGSDTPQFG